MLQMWVSNLYSLVGKNDYKSGALTLTPSRRPTIVVKLMVYKARRVNTEQKRYSER